MHPLYLPGRHWTGRGQESFCTHRPKTQHWMGFHMPMHWMTRAGFPATAATTSPTTFHVSWMLDMGQWVIPKRLDGHCSSKFIRIMVDSYHRFPDLQYISVISLTHLALDIFQWNFESGLNIVDSDHPYMILHDLNDIFTHICCIAPKEGYSMIFRYIFGYI